MDAGVGLAGWQQRTHREDKVSAEGVHHPAPAHLPTEPWCVSKRSRWPTQVRCLSHNKGLWLLTIEVLGLLLMQCCFGHGKWDTILPARPKTGLSITMTYIKLVVDFHMMVFTYANFWPGLCNMVTSHMWPCTRWGVVTLNWDVQYMWNSHPNLKTLYKNG
jgi:hypothetical protein